MSHAGDDVGRERKRGDDVCKRRDVGRGALDVFLRWADAGLQCRPKHAVGCPYLVYCGSGT